MDEPRLYIHLKLDGGILIERETGEQASVSEARLREDLARIKNKEGVLSYSRDQPQRDPATMIENTFKMILSFEIPIQLVDAHLSVLASTFEGYVPPLVYAAYHGEEDWLDELIRRGVDVEIPDRFGQTALMMAANAGHLHVVERLIENGANVNAKDPQGSTPIMFAAQHGYVDIVKALIKAGADIYARGAHGFDARRFAEQNGHSSVLALLPSKSVWEAIIRRRRR